MIVKVLEPYVRESINLSNTSTALIDKIGCIDMKSDVIFEKIDDKNNNEIMEFNTSLSVNEELIKKKKEE